MSPFSLARPISDVEVLPTGTIGFSSNQQVGRFGQLLQQIRPARRAIEGKEDHLHQGLASASRGLLRGFQLLIIIIIREEEGTVGRFGGAAGTGEDESNRFCCRADRLVKDVGSIWRPVETHTNKVYMKFNLTRSQAIGWFYPVDFVLFVFLLFQQLF